jgi:hypothetical protein
MKRWQKIATVCGFLIVLAFVVAVSLRPPRWADWRDLANDVGGLVLVYAEITATLLAIIVIFWGAYLLFRPKPRKDKPAVPLYSIAGRMLHVVGVAALSVVIGSAAAMLTVAGRSNIGALGWWVAGMLSKPGRDSNLGLFIMSAFVVDSAICFAILWGGYLLWMRFRQRCSR